MPKIEEIKADLFDPADKDNQRLVNLLDDGNWQQLIKEFDQGSGKSLSELIEDTLERR